MKKTNDIKISILVPVYNVEKCLEKCLQSLANQTYKNIEIICVEDCSTDNSKNILSKFAETCEKIVILEHESNRGLLQARKTAIENASGDYILFVDSDDTLESEACEILANELAKERVDILGFETNVINVGKDNFSDCMRTTEYLATKMKNRQKIVGDQIIKAIFSEQKISFNVWNKVYKTEIVKKAYSYVVDKNIVVAEDLYGTFLMAYFAKSFKFFDKKLYDYYYGFGVTTKQRTQMQKFEQKLSIFELTNNIKDFLNHVNASTTYFSVLEEINKQYAIVQVKQMFDNLSDEEYLIALSKMKMYFDEKQLVQVAYETYFESEDENFKFLTNDKKMRKIGVIYVEKSDERQKNIIDRFKMIFPISGYILEEVKEENNEFDCVIKIKEVQKDGILKNFSNKFLSLKTNIKQMGLKRTLKKVLSKIKRKK